jgi:hypothetical protein
MNKKSNITPIGLKGREVSDRMIQLMGIAPINEGVSRSAVELTKMGPDGVAYAIIRENREWYIKKADKSSNLVVEDFQYIGGLKNKKEAAYPSYASALKKLNLMFRSLAEAYNYEGEINITLNDNLLSESKVEEVVEEEVVEEEVELSEDEKAIDGMLGEETDHNTFDNADMLEGGADKLTESRMTISAAMKNMDELVDSLTVKKKV